ncbi:MAG: hypothetical protein OXE84_00515 [Rhodobacteraceae bacterium]|nr:hypothetical protein [Paracoccaceae bacterium]MCY4326955.1 hypothetical protein [Paracoccaceae bacterium]
MEFPVDIRRVTTGLVLAIWPLVSHAEISAYEAYQHLQDLASAQGGEIRPESVFVSEGVVKLNRVRIGAVGFPVDWGLTPEWIRFEERSNGTVRVSAPEVVPVEQTIFGAHRAVGTILAPGFSGLMTRDQNGVTFSLSGTTMWQYSAITAMPDGKQRQFAAELHDWRAVLVSGGARTNSVDAALSAGLLNAVLRDGQGANLFHTAMEGFRADYFGGFRNLFDLMADPFGMDWFRAKVSFKSVTTVVSTDVIEDNHLVIRSEGLEGEFSSRPDNVKSEIFSKDVTVQAISSGVVLGDISAGEVVLANDIIGGGGSMTTDIQIQSQISELEINRQFFATLDQDTAGTTIDESFPTGRLDLEGSVTIPSSQARRLFARDSMEFQPTDVIDWKLENLFVEFLGASLLASGEVKQTAPVESREGFRAAGQVRVEILGLKKLLRKLDSVNALNQRGKIASRLILSAGQEQMQDQFVYTLVFSPDGQIQINGFVIQ